jgi:hypothetical protein
MPQRGPPPLLLISTLALWQGCRCLSCVLAPQVPYETPSVLPGDAAISAVVQEFAAAAKVAVAECGFDGIEVSPAGQSLGDC